MSAFLNTNLPDLLNVLVSFVATGLVLVLIASAHLWRAHVHRERWRARVHRER